MADIRNTGTWQRVERGLSEMANLISRGEYNLALVKGRQTMEQIVRIQAGQRFVVYTDLQDTIEKLYDGHHIGKDARLAFHTIRMLGNKAVHEGDNDPNDAAKSYQYLKQEIERFAGGRSQNSQTAAGRQRGERQGAQAENAGERLRVPVERPSRTTEGRRRYDSLDDRGNRDRREVPNREDRMRARREGQSGKRRDRGGTARGQRKPAKKSGVTVYDVLRILIPVICVILLVMLIRGLMSGAEKAPETTAAPTETSAEVMTEPVTTMPPETEPETTAPAAVRYRIKGNAVNARYADNENRVYEQLANGTEIGEVEEIEGSDKVKFVRDGIELTVNKNYIEPIEEQAGTTEAETMPVTALAP